MMIGAQWNYIQYTMGIDAHKQIDELLKHLPGLIKKQILENEMKVKKV
jgi:hypothetical protein